VELAVVADTESVRYEKLGDRIEKLAGARASVGRYTSMRQPIRGKSNSLNVLRPAAATLQS
jgi:hypothetical protein